jgi:spectinomycin phosphotransferase
MSNKTLERIPSLDLNKEAKLAAQAFGLGEARVAESLCPYGPVYRLATAEGEFVLKRTGYPRSSGAAIAAWLAELGARQVAVVQPERSLAPNPRRVEASAWPGDWVVYPYVSGSAYTGDIEQIAAAGQLLGRIHACGLELGLDMLVEAILPLRSELWVPEQVERALAVSGEKVPRLHDAFRRVFSERATAHEAVRAALAAVQLPLVAASWDYKASNLVFQSSTSPVLVDPDHAGRLPRIYDLACALLLFHCDLASAPGRMFTPQEWRVFATAYSGACPLSEQELRLWPEILLSAWIDQALWLLANWPEGWDNKRERAYLANLALAPLEQYAAPAATGGADLQRADPALRSYLDAEGRLAIYPSKARHKQLALSYLVGSFERGRRYSEPEVNRIIRSRQTFDDWATLRRDLYEAGLILRTRNGMQYWRP